MEKIKTDINECNKEAAQKLIVLYNKLSNSLEQSYYYGQMTAYEDILKWLKNYENKSMKFIPPENIKNYFKEKGANSKIEKMICEENIKNKANKVNFNYLFYDQTFKNNICNNNNDKNIFPISVENALNHKNNINKSPSSFNFLYNNDIKSSEENFRLSLLLNSSLNNYQSKNNINNEDINNNKMEDDSFEEQIKPPKHLKNNIFPDMNLKKRKNE